MKYILFLFVTLIATNSYAQQVTWSSSIDIAPSGFGNLHPRVAIDGSGNAYVIWGKALSNECNFSKWNGISFSNPITINPSTIPVFTASWAGPDIASKGDTLYIIMKETPEDVNHIYLTSSFNGGTSFSQPVQVDNIGTDICRFPTLTVDDSGNPIVGFMKFDPNFSNARWVVTRSFDYGSTFTPDTLASGWLGGTVCDCCPGSITSFGNTVAMLYRDNLSNIRDSWSGISSDNGVSFSQGLNIDMNNWMLMACPSTGPDGVLIEDTLYSVFMNAASGTPSVYFSKASISNLQVNSVQPLSGNNNQNYPRISNFNSSIGVVWIENVSGNSKVLSRFASDINSGLNTFVDTLAISGAANADIEIANGKIYCVYQDDNSGVVKFKVGTYTPSTTNITNLYRFDFAISPNPSLKNDVRLSIQNLPDGEYKLEVTDLLGSSIQNDMIFFHDGKTEFNLELNPGIYFFNLETKSGILSKKLIKI